VADLTGLADCGWSYLVSFIHAPELNFVQFVRDCLHNNCFLTLYAYVLQQLPASQSLEDEQDTLNLLVDWNSTAKPRCRLNIYFVMIIKLQDCKLYWTTKAQFSDKPDLVTLTFLPLTSFP